MHWKVLYDLSRFMEYDKDAYFLPGWVLLVCRLITGRDRIHTGSEPFFQGQLGPDHTLVSELYGGIFHSAADEHSRVFGHASGKSSMGFLGIMIMQDLRHGAKAERFSLVYAGMRQLMSWVFAQQGKDDSGFFHVMDCTLNALRRRYFARKLVTMFIVGTMANGSGSV